MISRGSSPVDSLLPRMDQIRRRNQEINDTQSIQFTSVTNLSNSRLQIGKQAGNKNSSDLGAQSAAPKLPRSRKPSTMTHSMERAGDRILQ